MGGHGPMGMMMRGEKAHDFKGTMIKLIQYLSAYRVSVVIVMIFAAASTVFAIVGPKILGKATTKLFEGVMSQTLTSTKLSTSRPGSGQVAGSGSIDLGVVALFYQPRFSLRKLL